MEREKESALDARVSETNPYAPPKVETPEAELAPVEAKVDDPTALARWSVGLLIAVTVIDLIAHVLAVVAPDAAGAGVVAVVAEWGSVWIGLAGLVVFLCWTYRILWNAKRVDPETMTTSPGWGVGSYFVPIVQFWVPLRALIQASRVTGSSVGLVITWWVASLALILGAMGWVLLAYSSDAAGELLLDPDTGEPVVWFDHGIILADLVITALEVPMVLGITRRQREWVRGMVASEGGAT